MKTFKEFMSEALTRQVVRGSARQQYQRQALQQRVSGGNQTTPSPIFQKPKTITGFQTARGSKYTYKPQTKSWPQTQRTAPNDPYHPTPAGTKQKSDYTMFTTPDASMTMRQRFVSGSKEPFYQGLPQSTKPKVGRAPVEVWNQYAEKGGRKVIHPGSPIIDIQTATPGSGVGLYGNQRKELRKRVNTALKKPQNREALRRQSGIKPRGGSSTLPNVGRGVDQRPSGTGFTPGTGGNFGIGGIGLAN